MNEIMIDLMQSKREVFYEIVLEALEDVGLVNAMKEGRMGDYVPECVLMSRLNGNAT